MDSLSIDQKSPHMEYVDITKFQDADLVSIVIPNFNHGKYIGQAIQSVLCQDYPNFEIIVVDDGSTDNSSEVVAQFGEKVHYIWQKNQGLSAARNTGIRASNGQYIGVLDADDLYEPNFISTMMSNLKSQSDADGIYCGYQFVDENNRLLPQIEARSIPETGLYRALLDGNFLVPESVLVHRYCYSKVGDFDPLLSACEDWDMWLRITSQYKIISTSKILTRHRTLPGSMSSNPSRMLSNRLAVLNKHLGPLSHGIEPVSSMNRRAYGRAYLSSCIEYLQYGSRENAFECLQNMSITCPSLLAELDTFYQLACGDQPKGSMGDVFSIDLDRNEQVLMEMLSQLFEDDKTGGLEGFRSLAYSNAYFALGMIGYAAGKNKSARRNLTKAILKNARLGTRKSFVFLWIKTFLNAQFISFFRRWRQKTKMLGEN